jgi:hypothetical protein
MDFFMSKKHLLDLIKKIAQGKDPLDDPEILGTSTTHTSGAVPAGGYVGSGGNPKVKALQQALVNLSHDVTSKIEIKDPVQAAKNKAFNSFVAGNLKDVNVEAMGNIGGPKTPFVPDGDWGNKTQEALRNARAFAAIMLALVKQYNLDKKVTAYNETDLAHFTDTEKNANQITPAQKEEWAPLYTDHIDAIHKMYDQMRGFSTVGHEATEISKQVLNADQMASLQNTFRKGFAILVPGGDPTKPHVITVKDLITPAAFNNWKEVNKVDLPLQKVVDQIRSRIGNTSGAGIQGI